MAAENRRYSKSRRGGGPVRLAARLERSLSAYAAAAAAAGVSLLALSPAANAKIVYTPANTLIPYGYVQLDLNHDGMADFSFGNGAYTRTSMAVGCALHTTFRGNPPRGAACNYLTDQIWGRGVASGRFASALPAGFKVRANKSYFQAARYPLRASMGAVFSGGEGCFPYPCSTAPGQWLNTKNRYLGLQFVINGQVHYGWARLSVNVRTPTLKESGLYVILTGYAYETVPNKPIITGKTNGPDVITLDPATLGHLAGGGSLIPAWRGARENKAAAPEHSRWNTGQGSQTAP